MKIKILKTGEIVDAIIDKHGMCLYLLGGEVIRTHSNNVEIIPEPPQPKFKLGDKLIHLANTDESDVTIFQVHSICLDIGGYTYYDGACDFELSTGVHESLLCEYIEKSKTVEKSHKYIECGELNGEVLYKKVEE